MKSENRCCVCPEKHLTGIIVAGQPLLLCQTHLDKLGDRRPESFDDLATFFAALGADRRTLSERRGGERRMFPPRPELRRHDMGRRAGDPDA